VPGLFGSFPDALLPGMNLVEGGQASAGSIISWFKNHFARDLTLAQKRGGSSAYQLLDQEAAAVPAGSEGLVVLDYFQGNRTPHTDSLSRGAVWGLSLRSSRGHLYRALMEGIAYGLEEIVDTFRVNGVPVSRVIACGGAVQSALLMQIYADVLGRSLFLPRIMEASLLGSAVVAAAGTGAYKDLARASRGMVRLAGQRRPNPELHEQYQFYVRQYRATYPQLKDLMQGMSIWQRGG
jgi:ribulose kinase